MRNLITDVPGILVGNADDARAATGVTVAVFESSAVASVATSGGAPGDRAVTMLEPEMTRGMIDAVVLSGGSLYGLDAAGGVTAVLCRQGKGAQFGGLTLPVAVQAILFDLVNGGAKDWLSEPVDKRPPYWDLGRDATLAAAQDFALGTVGAGYGATTVTAKGGLGSASTRTRQGFTVGALAAVNAVGSALIGEGPHFWAAPYEQDAEFGGLGWPQKMSPGGSRPALQGRHGPEHHHRPGRDRRRADQGAVQAPGARRPRPISQERGRTIWWDEFGDTVFAASTGRAGPPHFPLGGEPPVLTELGTAAADCLARAVARGVYEATALPYKTAVPDWKTRFGGGRR